MTLFSPFFRLCEQWLTAKRVWHKSRGIRVFQACAQLRRKMRVLIIENLVFDNRQWRLLSVGRAEQCCGFIRCTWIRQSRVCFDQLCDKAWHSDKRRLDWWIRTFVLGYHRRSESDFDAIVNIHCSRLWGNQKKYTISDGSAALLCSAEEKNGRAGQNRGAQVCSDFHDLKQSRAKQSRAEW